MTSVDLLYINTFFIEEGTSQFLKTTLSVSLESSRDDTHKKLSLFRPYNIQQNIQKTWLLKKVLKNVQFQVPIFDSQRITV